MLASLNSLATTRTLAATKIKRLVSSCGIEAWFLQDPTVPLIAMEYAFGGGATQDPSGKPGVGNMVAGLLDEGSGDLGFKTFHERLDRRAIKLSLERPTITSAVPCARSRTTGTRPSTFYGWR